MNLTATITRRIPITQLRPGALIDGHTVHKVELEADGAAALCFPPGRTDGRRVRVPLGPIDGEVTVAAGAGEVQAFVQEVELALLSDDDAPLVSSADNALLAVELPSGWTFALHGDEPAPEPTGPLPEPDDDNEED
jgi:hypothetical protein